MVEDLETVESVALGYDTDEKSSSAREGIYILKITLG